MIGVVSPVGGHIDRQTVNIFPHSDLENQIAEMPAHTQKETHSEIHQSGGGIPSPYFHFCLSLSDYAIGQAENETTIGISVERLGRWLCASSELIFDFLWAVVVSLFRACNPIFHTPFLHHFGVEQYRIT